MNSTITDILFSAIIGDAAGYTLNGMKKNHIKAVFKEITGFTDPAPALKDNMQRWKKPGLYSSITQNILITAACTDKRGMNFNEYIKAVKNSPEVSGTEYGIFRDPGEAEKEFIYNIKNGINHGTQYHIPCSRLLPPVLSLLLIQNEKELLISAVKYISLFTKNSSTIACSIMLLQLIKYLITEKDQTILKTALLAAKKAKYELTLNQMKIFDSGLNPDYIISDTDLLLNLFTELNERDNPAEYERIICSFADKKNTNTITRGSVNLPGTILPMAVVLSDQCSDPERIFFIAALEGGSSSSLTALSAAISAAFHGIHIPENLMRDLANKKKLSAILDLIAGEKERSSIITEIYNSEPGLTIKELEEYRAKNKNIPVEKATKKKTRGEIESELSKHVVEKWTKVDKAKWKKERKNSNL